MEEITYNETLSQLNYIFENYGKGDLVVICPKCKKEVIIAITPGDVKKYQRGPGMFCPNGDFWRLFNMHK